MIKQQLDRFNRLELLGGATALEKLERLSAWLGRDVYVKRDDTTPLALGGNKLRKLEYLAADALAQGADTLVTAGAIQSNHVRQTAALAAKLGLGCVALLENPTGTEDPNYLANGNRLLLELFDAKVELVENLDNVDDQLNAVADRLRSNGKKPYLVPIGGSNALGALGYVRAGLELAGQIEDSGIQFSTVVLASGSAGTHSGLALALAEVLPDLQVIGVTVSRTDEAQRPKVQGLAERTAELLGVPVPDAFKVILWDEYFAPVMANRVPARWRRSSWWPARKACCWTRSTLAKPWPGCWTALAGSALKRGRSSSCTPVAHPPCLRMIRAFDIP